MKRRTLRQDRPGAPRPGRLRRRPRPRDEKKFNGLGMGLGNLSRLSKAQTRSISPENFTGEKGKAGMATDGPAAKSRPRPRPGLEDLALRPHQAQARPSPWPTSRAPAPSSRSG